VRYNRAGDPVGVFSVNGIVQATHQDLERFFASKGRKGQKYTKKEWYTAQLDFYGVPHEKRARNADLEKLLKTAFKDGKVSDSDGSFFLLRREVFFRSLVYGLRRDSLTLTDQNL